MQNLNELAKEINAIAKDKGWHDEERTFGEYCALFHAEVSEILEQYREGYTYTHIYTEHCNADCDSNCKSCKHKPEGIPIELADCIIRVLDYCGQYNVDIEYFVNEVYKMIDNGGSLYPDKKPDKFAEYITELHDRLSQSHKAITRHWSWITKLNLLHLAVFICIIFDFCKTHEIDIQAAINQKIAYNRTRPYKHEKVI